MGGFLAISEFWTNLSIGTPFPQGQSLLVKMSYQQVIGNHRLIQVGLERFIASFAQPVISKITFQTLYHPLNRRTAAHDGFEPFGHRGIVWIDVWQGVKGNRYCSS